MIKDLVITCSNANRDTPSMSNISPEKREYLEKKFLRQLKYDRMALRRESVEEAHKETFRWIFDKRGEQKGDWDNFQEWLDTPQQQLYWITGKPGSGKTTLMKLICDAITGTNPFGPHFDLGPQDESPTVATFFFWAAGGSEMQKSREGLFRTLTHQLLSQHSELIASVSADRWQEFCLFGDDPTSFTEPELRTLLQKCLNALSDKKVLLFIDGLDEFSGNHDDLVQFFAGLMTTYAFKICVSSRPWQVFEEAFKHRPSLRIHTLTHCDISSFLLSSLRESQHFITLEEEARDEAIDLPGRILEKAQGVFMWIKIVAGCLREALRAEEPIGKLYELIDNLPDTSLDDLFHQILQDLEPRNLTRAANYIRLMKAQHAIDKNRGLPLPAMLLYYADELDLESSTSLPVKEFQAMDASKGLSIIRGRINTSCKGLLEYIESSSNDEDLDMDLDESLDPPYPSTLTMAAMIQYPHRSVKDYLNSPRAQTMLSTSTGPDPHLRLCSAYLVRFKSQYIPAQIDNNSWESALLGLETAYCLRHASMVPNQYSKQLIAVMEILRTSLQVLSGQAAMALSSAPELDHLHVLSSDGLYYGVSTRVCKESKFLSLMVVFKVAEHVKHILTQTREVAQQPQMSFWRSRIRRAYRSKSDPRTKLDGLLEIATLFQEPSLEIVELLLRSGANPNTIPHQSDITSFGDQDDSSTCWEKVLGMFILKCQHETTDLPSKQLWAQIGRLMVIHGAKVDSQSVANALKLIHSRAAILVVEGSEDSLVKVLKDVLRELTSKKSIEEAFHTRTRWRVHEGKISIVNDT